MADEPRRNPILSPAPLIALALLAAGVIVKNIPLESPRPADAERRKTTIVGQQNVEGRLWQDPFVAVDAEIVSIARELGIASGSVRRPRQAAELANLASRDESHRLQGARDAIAAAVAAGNQVMLVGAMVFGGSYPEDTENRRRNRMALVSGLIASGFAPDDADHLGYFWTEAAAGVTLPKVVPYEWFSLSASGERQAQKALVLWLEDEAFGARPLAGLSALVRQLVCASPDLSRCVFDPREHGMRVIGPAGSDTFTQIFAEAGAGPAPADLVRLDFYSPYATISPWQPDPLPAADATAPRTGRFAFHGRWGSLCSMTRTIGGDDALIAALVDELALRSALPLAERERSPRDQPRKRTAVLAITERDTAYSNRLAELLRSAVGNHCGKDCVVMRYNYLRGLDGMLPDGATAGDASARRDARGKDASPEELLKGMAPRERAIGRGQFDYLRRLADDIDRQLGEAAETVDVRAIGIFGNDVYDKLIVLQALRDRFPHAVFFTTDLDARLLQPDQSEWTRNLVVASNFGLALNPGLQRGTPPFRDGYQTAAYLATLLALAPTGSAPSRERVHRWVGLEEHVSRATPADRCDGVPGVASGPVGKRLFELGRTRAVELDGNASHCVCRDLATCPNIHSLAETNYPTGFDRRTWLLGCLSALLLLLTWRRPQAWLASYDFRWATARANVGRFLGWALLAFLVAKGAHTFWTTLVEGIRSGAGEPFLWSEGVSMWPAQVFRLISIVLSIVFLVHVARSMRETMRDIESSIGIAPDPLFTETARGADLWLRGPLRPFEGEGMEGTRYDAGEQPTEMVRIEALWAGFRNRLRLAGAWRWIALVTIVLCLMSWLAESGPWRPFLPHRGNLVQYTDRFLEFWHIALGALLLVTVVYITRVTRAFIVRLAEKPSDWPSKVLDNAAHAEGMPPEMLASWVDFRLLVKLSERVSTLIYYPFVILALGIVSRNSFFDATEWPLALQIVIGLSLLYALHSAYAMRRAAEFARDEAIRHYAGRVMRLNGGKSNLPERLRANFEPAALAKQCSDLIARIRSEEGGAFKPFSQQPIVKAILIPLGGFGGVSLAEYFALASL